jgi:hypothetical protein
MAAALIRKFANLAFQRWRTAMDSNETLANKITTLALKLRRDENGPVPGRHPHKLHPDDAEFVSRAAEEILGRGKRARKDVRHNFQHGDGQPARVVVEKT